VNRQERRSSAWQSRKRLVHGLGSSSIVWLSYNAVKPIGVNESTEFTFTRQTLALHGVVNLYRSVTAGRNNQTSSNISKRLFERNDTNLIGLQLFAVSTSGAADLGNQSQHGPF
jgi:hypothetical protein